MLIDLFIAANWHTVPLKGKLERLPNGDKTIPHFEENWKEKYTNKFNTNTCKLAGVITGACSGIVAVDCDNQFTYDLIKSFDPDYTFHFVSKGKPSGGGTIIYKYTPEIATFKFHMETISLDFYSDEGFVYLPTENNLTKESWADKYELPELREIPKGVVNLLMAFKHKFDKGTPTLKQVMPRHNISNRLAPMLEQFIDKGEYNPILFKILTPYSFRDLPSYVAKGHMHPNDVPKGRGSEYLSKISAILGADISVNVELYTSVMMLINQLWDEPMDRGRLNATIINPMVDGTVTIEGQVVWQYDEYWSDMGYVATAINGDYIESFYDDVKGLYYIINYTMMYVKTFHEKAQAMKTIKTLTGRNVTEVMYDSVKQIIRTSLLPCNEFGHIESSDKFNLFRQSQQLSIINNPEPYKDMYKRPDTIIKYLETLIPDDFVRQYVLRFIRTKFTTFKFSPIIFYFIGKPGSGKDTFVNILRKTIGDDYVSKPDTKVFLEQYNGWMIDQFFIQLDEYGNKLNRVVDKQEVLGKLKAYTGSEDIQIRAMRQDGFNYTHNITFILTANSNPLPVELDDRRVLFIKTPNRLDKQDWVKEAGGITVVQSKIKAELMDFCYYLATEIDNLSDDDYMIPPDTLDKEELILENLPAADKICYMIQSDKFEELAELALEYGIVNFKNGWERSRLEDEKLQELYEAMTEGHGSSRTIINKLKSISMPRQHSTRGGGNYFYYHVNGLSKYAQSEGDFDNSNVAKVKPKGLQNG